MAWIDILLKYLNDEEFFNGEIETQSKFSLLSGSLLVPDAKGSCCDFRGKSDT